MSSMASSAASSPPGSTADISFHLPISRPPSPLERPPAVCGLPLKYVSLITLAVQNALLTIIMHYSRVSIPASKSYNAGLAVLLNELLKGSISLGIALSRIDKTRPSDFRAGGGLYSTTPPSFSAAWASRCRRLAKEIFSADCWKLSIPAILYVIQNNLQYVAASNLDIATFQVTYQMKILTTAAFSVMLLRRKLSPMKWLALIALAVGVGIVQIQAVTAKPGSAQSSLRHSEHGMNPVKGFMAVSAACFTSGLAGVYFEMVLKNSQADLWVRNVQLSLFSLLPALAPILFTEAPTSASWFRDLFRNFGAWAWATVGIQVFGGLITAVVIKYSDNILKGFATSLSIIISFLASVVLFNFKITPGFVVGASVVLASTWMYNQPGPKESSSGATLQPSGIRSTASSYPGSPVDGDAPILGQYPMKKRSSLTAISALSQAPRLANMLGFTPTHSRTPSDPPPSYTNGGGRGDGYFSDKDLAAAQLGAPQPGHKMYLYAGSRQSILTSPPSFDSLEDTHVVDLDR